MEKESGSKYFTTIDQHPMWQKQIKPFLSKFVRRQIPQEDIVKALHHLNREYSFHRYEHIPFGRKPKPIQFKVLDKLYSNQLPQLMNDLAQFLLNFKPNPIPIITSQKNQRVEFYKGDLLYLVTLMFMQLVPEQYYDDKEQFKGKFHEHNTFGHVLSYSQFKTRCIVQYLKKTIKQFIKEKQLKQKCYVVRNFVDFMVTDIINALPGRPMSKIKIETNKASIEDFDGQIKVDFANRFIGGGCLKNGCVQEEIMFAIRPQLYAMTLVCEKMDPEQALSFVGFKRYFDNEGYGDKTKYAGLANVKYGFRKYDDVVLYDENIVAIDAIKFKAKDPEQFSQKQIDRQILKAYAGFSSLDIDARVITGGWGCGVYNGDFTLKVAIQWIAATMAGKQIVICPFGRKEKLEETGLIKLLSDMRLDGAYRLLMVAGDLISKQGSKGSIADVMLKVVNKGKF